MENGLLENGIGPEGLMPGGRLKMGLAPDAKTTTTSGLDGRSSTGGKKVVRIVVGALIVRPHRRDDLARAAEDELRSGEIGNRAEVGPAGDAVDFNRAAIVGVGQKIDKAQQTDERHQDAHADSATPEESSAHVPWPVKIAEVDHSRSPGE
jgi:hypothetical protein